MSVCLICEEQGRRLNRAAGLDVCDHCMRGHAALAIQARGCLWAYDATRSSDFRQVKDSHLVTVEATFGHPVPAMHFANRGVWQRMKSLFKGVLAGEPLFDRMVYAEGDVRPFIDDPDVRSCLLELMNWRPRIHVVDAQLSFVARSLELPDRSELEMAVAALWVHIDHFASRDTR